MLIITSVCEKYLKVQENNKAYTLYGFDIVLLLKKNTLILCDLSKNGLLLIECLRNLNITPASIKTHNNDIYKIYLYRCVIKCYIKLGYQLTNSSVTSVDTYLNELDNFLVTNLNTSLLNPLINSLAGVASIILHHNAKNTNPPFIKTSDALSKILKTNLFGGRCELISPGLHHNNVYEFDFPSMYGNIMLGEFPTECLDFKPCRQKIEYEGDGFYEVTCYQKDTLLPNLPIKTSVGVFFVVGLFKTIVYSEELDFFLQSGGVVVQYHSFAKTSNFKKIFANTIEPLLILKQKNFAFAKSLINTIYGRLALTQTQTVSKLLTNITEDELIRDKNLVSYIKKNSSYLAQYKNMQKQQNVDNNLVAACIITTRGRIILLKLIQLLLRNNFKILYMDTDSVFIQAGSQSNLDFLNGGGWRKLDWVEFYTEKNYKYSKNKIIVQRGSFEGGNLSTKRKNTKNLTRAYAATELLHNPNENKLDIT